jgi:hypothetical protein
MPKAAAAGTEASVPSSPEQAQHAPRRVCERRRKDAGDIEDVLVGVERGVDDDADDADDWNPSALTVIPVKEYV